MSDFPQIAALHARHSQDPDSVDHSRAVVQTEGSDSTTVVDNVQNVAPLITTQATRQKRSYLDTLLTEIKGELPAYYHVGLLGYCQGKDGTISSCSKPDPSFSFSLWGTFSTYAAKVVSLLGNDRGNFLSGNVHNSYAITCLYISSFVTAFVTLIMGITRVLVSRGGGLFLVFSTVCFLQAQ